MHPDQIDPKKFIIIKNARVHNLKGLTLAIPRNKLVVITGLSGSGKSSLAFDTLFAEGQRRYVESLSSYARQFIGRMNKPEVEYIRGIAPAIAIEQKVNTKNPRSTVGTSTEIYDYLKLLFARIGKTISPTSGKEVKKHQVEHVVDFVNQLPKETRIHLLCPLILQHERDLQEELGVLLQKGYSRISIDGQILKIQDFINEKTALATEKKKTKKRDIPPFILIDRLEVNPENEENNSRLADSIQTAFYEGNGELLVQSILKETQESTYSVFTNKFEEDGMSFEEPSVQFFSFNNPYGACKNCEGFGTVIGIDPDLVIPDKSLSVYEGAIACWKGEKMSEWKEVLIKNSLKFDFPIHRAYRDLDDADRKLLWTGNGYFQGIDDFFNHLESQSYKIQYRVMLSRFRGRKSCPECLGTRLRKDATYVKVGSKSIAEIVLMPIKQCIPFFENLKLSAHDSQIAKRILIEINSRLKFLSEVGLGYLTLNRLSNSLSGGESQRINLATSLGSSLVGSMYILDEPSIGLHPRDTGLLTGVLRALQKLGNTVIVVEHEEEIMREADELIDIGPLAGIHGGELVFQGSYNEILKDKNSLTGKYLSGKQGIPIPSKRRKWRNFIEVNGISENNLKNLDIKFPLEIMTVVTGVSGSGKTSLVKKVLYPALKKIYGGFEDYSGRFDKIGGDLKMLKSVEMIDQNPIGKSSRSNPVTYVKAFDEIRSLFSELPISKSRGLKPGHFSFNVEGGRCEICQGEGEVTIEMQFMADIHLLCEACGGKRFKDEILEITYRDKNISDILNLTVEEAMAFFNGEGKFPTIEKRISARIKPLADVGLGYIGLGQSSNTLSGGEAQRIKLASFLGKGESAEKTLFIFDEPTTGLHFHDIQKLLYAFDALVKQSHSVLIIEHNPEIIKCADWVIDLGPEGGEEGGNVLFTGIPEDLIHCKESYTGRYLKNKM